VSSISEGAILDAFKLLKEGAFAKEALPSLFREIANGTSPKDAVSKLGLGAVDESEAMKVIAEIVKGREKFVREKGMASIGPLMGPVMDALRGRIDGKRMNEILTAEIKKLIA
jgi:glutamyl-tRNA(Gln) amidotransferase subunit E